MLPSRYPTLLLLCKRLPFHLVSENFMATEIFADLLLRIEELIKCRVHANDV